MGEGAGLMGLEDGLLEELRESRLEFKINGPLQSERRLPGLLNLTFPGLEGEALVHGLDAKGLAASSGAACAAGASFPSHVRLATGRSPRRAKEGLRLSLGKSKTMEQVRQLAAALGGVVKNFQNSPSFL